MANSALLSHAAKEGAWVALLLEPLKDAHYALPAQRAVYLDRHALAAEVVDDVERAEDAPVGQRVGDEVHAPALIGLGRRVELLAPGRGDALADAAPHDEPLLAVEAVDQLVIDGPALAPELLVQHPVAVASSLRRQLAEVLAQLRVLHPLAAVPTGRACQLDDAAGAPLADRSEEHT